MNDFTRCATAALSLSLLVAMPADAAELYGDRFYAGGGLSHNEVNSADGNGLQFFGGYRLPARLGAADPAVEVGYWDSGDLDVSTPSGDRDVSAEGVWVNGVVQVPLSDGVSLIGRAGYDFGDDDGLMAGGGLGVALSERISVRGEIVVRDETDSLQGNLVYWF